MKNLKYKDSEGNWQSLYDIYEISQDSSSKYEYVDMGEAGFWTKNNIGAEKETDSGLYFEMGVPIGYTKDNFKSIVNYSYVESLYKAINSSRYGLTEYDGVNKYLGGAWRIPSNDNFRKLLEVCDYKYIKNYNTSGVNGMLFTLKSDNSKQLFFPACGYVWQSEEGDSHLNEDNNGYYRTDCFVSNDVYSDTLYFTENSCTITDFYDSDGYVKYGLSLKGFAPAGTDSSLLENKS